MSLVIREEHQVLDDYGDFYRSADRFTSASPTTLEEVQAALLYAREHRLAVRVRGHHHSMNGSALPQQGELLLYTSGLDYYRFGADTLTVGAGAVVFFADQLLRQRGLRLQLVNDGGHPTASAGGFVAAGGLGEDTWLYGGFWETVERIKAVTVDGEVLELTREDELFRWLFGSMGQLAVVVEVTLKVIALDPRNPPPFPAGETGTVRGAPYTWEKNFWLTLFVPDDEWQQAKAELDELARVHADAWSRRNDYVYPIRFRTFNPPLIFPGSGRFAAVGVWGEAPGGGRFDFAKLAVIEQHFDAILARHPHWRRYIQSELTFGQRDWAATFGADVFAEYRRMKNRFDPHSRLNPGVIFEANPRTPGPAPSIGERA